MYPANTLQAEYYFLREIPLVELHNVGVFLAYVIPWINKASLAL